MDENWDTEKLKQSDLSKEVVSIHLIAYPNSSNEGDEEGLPPTNHWCLFLESDRDNSVRFDMTPGIHRITFKVIAPLNAAMLVELVQKNGRQNYQFTPDWEGCRFWNYTFLQDLEKAKIIHQGSSAKAEEALSFYFRTPSGVEKREMSMGKFGA
ncbi:hypothetical protein F4808DRAFT_458871 [Astrocystis sublimbata]|nr:hypothetical protein F4808DRAFT_458871 [Astrocystis sublimbata]